MIGLGYIDDMGVWIFEKFDMTVASVETLIIIRIILMLMGDNVLWCSVVYAV